VTEENIVLSTLLDLRQSVGRIEQKFDGQAREFEAARQLSARTTEEVAALKSKVDQYVGALAVRRNIWQTFTAVGASVLGAIATLIATGRHH
jgi:hypothetical protein